MRLQLKAVLAIATLLLLTILALSLGAVHLMERSLREETSRRGAEFSENLAQLAEYPLFVRDIRGLEEIIAERAGALDIGYICFEDEAGVVLAAWHAGGSSPRLDGGGGGLEAPGPLAGGGTREGRDPGLSCAARAGGDRREHMDVEEFAAAVRLRPDSAPAGTPGAGRQSFSRPVGRVRVGMDYRHVKQAMTRIKKAVAATALPIAFIGLGVTLVLVRRVVRPLQELARGIGEVGRGRLDREVPVRGRDEVAELALAFNHMLRDLKASREELERTHENLEHMVRRRTRQLEESNRELAAASRTKSEFLASMSDGLRTPLNTILGFLGLVIEGQYENRDEERELLHEAQQGAEHLLSIINSILDLARIEMGKMDVQPGEVRVAEVFHEADFLLRGQAELKGLDLSFDMSSPDMPSVFADPGKLIQVLVNLAGNAFQFTERGSVRVSAQLCEDRGYVLFEVRDTGAGIPPEKQHLLFLKFEQLDVSHTRRHGGAGLGLPICRALVEMMGGRVWIEDSEKGKGTAIRFTVPIYRGIEQLETVQLQAPLQEVPVDPGPGASAEAASPRGQDGKPLVLVVEDDPNFRQLLRAIFTQCGYRVEEADCAEEAYRSARQLKPDLVTVDLALPSRGGVKLADGCDLIRAIQANPDTQAAQLMLLSGQERKVIEERLGREPLDWVPAILQKPFDPQELITWAESMKAQIQQASKPG